MSNQKTLGIRSSKPAGDDMASGSVHADDVGAASSPGGEGEALAATSPERSKLSAPKAAADKGIGKRTNLQDAFLNALRKSKVPVTMFLVKGVKLQGIITWFDNFSILLRRDGQTQLVYKHAISTIMPGQPVDADQFPYGITKGNANNLQDVFLSRVREAGVQVTMFLVNGVMLQGRIAAFDLFSVMLEREGYVQLAYKHAISTVQPAAAVDLMPDQEGGSA